MKIAIGSKTLHISSGVPLAIKSPFRARNLLFVLLFLGVISGIFLFFELVPKAKADLTEIPIQEAPTDLTLIQENSLLGISGPNNPEPEVIWKTTMIITGYSSTEDQTDSDPFITAAGTLVNDGLVASNMLSFGTKVKIPELFGDKIFVVEDRMSWEKGKYQIDVWFPARDLALEFGVKKTEVLILSD